jgi:hypothetical protein
LYTIDTVYYIFTGISLSQECVLEDNIIRIEGIAGVQESQEDKTYHNYTDSNINIEGYYTNDDDDDYYASSGHGESSKNDSLFIDNEFELNNREDNAKSETMDKEIKIAQSNKDFTTDTCIWGKIQI